MKEVGYGDYAIRVPRAWHVFDLASDPSRCVRFDRHAVYLGRPGANQRCPAHAVGHTGAILIEPGMGASGGAAVGVIRLARGRLTPRALPPPTASEVSFAAPSAGVTVTAAWGRDRDLVARILAGARRRAGATPNTGGPRSSRERARPPVQRHAAASSYYTGLGFDACSAPSAATMSAWSASPYRAVGIYIGGVNRGCSQPNLSASWVSGEIAAGWQLIPTYVGLQAPSNSCGCAAIDPAQAGPQGRAAADDAVSKAGALGLGSGTPIYFDMEGYSRGSTNSGAVLSFLQSWTLELHATGYVAGVYSSASSGITDLVSRYGSGYTEPDDIWIADWNGQATVSDPYVPAGEWSNHQRLHQFRGGHQETYGGASIDIDSDYLDGAVAGSGASRPLVTRRSCGKVLFRRGSRYGAFKIRGFNAFCAKARAVAAASRLRRYGPSGRVRRYSALHFACLGHDQHPGRARVLYSCVRGKARVVFVRTQ